MTELITGSVKKKTAARLYFCKTARLHFSKKQSIYITYTTA